MSHGYGKFATTIAILASAVLVTPQIVQADDQVNTDKQPANSSFAQPSVPVTGGSSAQAEPQAERIAQAPHTGKEPSPVMQHSSPAPESLRIPRPVHEQAPANAGPSAAPERPPTSSVPRPAPPRSSSKPPSLAPDRSESTPPSQTPQRSPSSDRHQEAEDAGPQSTPERENSHAVTAHAAPAPVHKRAATGVPTAPHAVPLESLLQHAASALPAKHHNRLAMVVDMNNHAFEMIDSGDFKGAIRQLDNAISIQAEDFLYRSRGYAYLRAGNLDMARLDCLQAIRLNPSNSTSWCNLGFIYANQGNVQHALSALDRSISINPSNAMALATKGHLLQLSGDQQGARKCLDKAVASDSNCALAWNNRAALKLDTGDKAGALSDVREATRLEPSNAQYQQNSQFISKFTDGSKLRISDGAAFQQREQSTK